MDLTLEDVTAAVGLVARGLDRGEDGAALAAELLDRAAEASRFRRESGRVSPRLGDGSIAAAARLMETPADRRSGAGQRRMLQACAIICAALLDDAEVPWP